MADTSSLARSLRATNSLSRSRSPRHSPATSLSRLSRLPRAASSRSLLKVFTSSSEALHRGLNLSFSMACADTYVLFLQTFMAELSGLLRSRRRVGLFCRRRPSLRSLLAPFFSPSARASEALPPEVATRYLLVNSSTIWRRQYTAI